MQGKITVVGSANVDFTMHVPFLPRKGESVNAVSFGQSFGGKGSNQAIAARRAGAEVAGVFNLGDDAFAGELVAIYEREGVDATHVVRERGRLCGTGVILVDGAGDNLICTALEANGSLTPERVEAAEAVIAESALVMLQMEVPAAANRAAIRLAKKHGVRVMLNYAPASGGELAIDRDIDYLVVNESEAEHLTNMPVGAPEAAAVAAMQLHEKTAGVVVVTLGGMGSVVLSEGRTAHYPAMAAEVVDVTAAGDSYCGALAAMLAGGAGIPEAVAIATAAGALCVGKAGALASIPRFDDIAGFLGEMEG